MDINWQYNAGNLISMIKILDKFKLWIIFKVLKYKPVEPTGKIIHVEKKIIKLQDRNLFDPKILNNNPDLKENLLENMKRDMIYKLANKMYNEGLLTFKTRGIPEYMKEPKIIELTLDLEVVHPKEHTIL